jgi:flagellar biosynthetic protein FliR/FlhB
VSGEKTEQPTDKKKEDALKKGQVAVSKDIQITVKLLAFYFLLFWLAKDYDVKFSNLLDQIIEVGFSSHHTLAGPLFFEALELLVALALPLLFVCAIMGTLSTWGQTGFVVAPEALTPSFKKLNAVETIKSMFSKKSFVQLFLSIVKVAILTFVGYKIFMGAIGDIVYSYRVGLIPLLNVLEEILEDMIFISLGIFLVIAVIDWAAVYFHHIKSLKMSIQDVKDEQKQTFGNPHVKQRQRREQRSILNASLTKVSNSKVMVANPTHISVALDYEPGKHDLPFILAMGEDEDALEMRRHAKKLGIPIIVNVPLARMLLADCEEEQYIQKQHLELAAEVFKALMQMQQAEQQKQPPQ